MPNDSSNVPNSDVADYWSLVDRAQGLIPSHVDGVDMEASRLVMSLNRATRTVIYDLEVQTLRPLHQTDSTFRVLFVLWVAGPLSPHMVASLSSMPRPTVSSLVASLRKAGLIDRQDDPEDGRGATLSLTSEGTAVITKAFADHNRREHEWASLLTPIERQLLIMLLEKLMNGRRDIGAVERH
ncbi:MarR family winged helix-turn-helix transcriptional regulator [Rhodococcus sp. NPDC003382]|uniref:MarR family winged helix-turn-helix transcriptional regulator n=1 Tax=unclassified Rhodococcus (in: high G+C Gram-positive bacteria) TaxID=192944 RepID=UPI0018CDD4C2|nr:MULTISPECIES: MarR family transcriptional regulator [unclassified Rhodococcus (in: high G+C Gram-positive bacteria)]MBH0120500.1 MarR family transcriptional regulator [Rhodococcus sp. CX]MCK8673203.1 MarR family transcriptional regulator [Rhodococcus sp. HM1]